MRRREGNPRGERVGHFRAHFDGCERFGRPRSPISADTTLREDIRVLLARLALSPARFQVALFLRKREHIYPRTGGYSYLTAESISRTVS